MYEEFLQTFIECYTDKIGKANRDCDRVQGYDIQQASGPGYLPVAVVRNEVMVTEYKNTGQITWCRTQNSTSLDILKTRLQCLYSDRHQKLYINNDDNR